MAPKGYYTGYSYCGYMPDGRKEYFVSDQEYVEAYDEELMEQGLHFFAKITTIIVEGRRHSILFKGLRGCRKSLPYFLSQLKQASR